MKLDGASLTVMLNGAEVVEPKPFVAARVIGPNTPAAVGTPESKPFAAVSVNPAGSVPLFTA